MQKAEVQRIESSADETTGSTARMPAGTPVEGLAKVSLLLGGIRERFLDDKDVHSSIAIGQAKDIIDRVLVAHLASMDRDEMLTTKDTDYELS